MWRARATGATGVQVDAKMGSNYRMACWRSKLRQFIRNKNPCDFWAQRRNARKGVKVRLEKAVLVATEHAGGNKVKQVVSLGIPESRQSSFGWNQHIWPKWMKTNCAISQSYPKLWLTNQVAKSTIFSPVESIQWSTRFGPSDWLELRFGPRFRLTGWRCGWTNPSEKYATVKLDHIPKFRGKNIWKHHQKRSRCQSVSSNCLRLIQIVTKT